MQQAPVMKSSGLAPINDEPLHVFGRNLEERVVESKQEEESPERKQIEEDKKKEQEDDLESIKKRKFDTTGEEDEETSFQGDFKLFIWDKSSSNWIEKGRGQLKLNDSVNSRQNRSRLIMRTGGTYRIILNVAIQHSFFKVISSTKTSIRFTDSLNVWAASGSNAEQLSDLIGERLSAAAKQAASSSDLKKDEEVEDGAKLSGNESDSVSDRSRESCCEEKDNGTSNNQRLEENNLKQQPEEKQPNEELEEKTEQSKERHQNEQCTDTDDANEPAKKIKLSSN